MSLRAPAVVIGSRKKIGKMGPGDIPFLNRDAQGRVVFTTGNLSDLLAVAPRTVAKWCDSGKLKSWRVPASQDRRIYGHDLEAFLKEHEVPLPPGMESLLRGGKDIILFGVRSDVVTRVVAEFHGRDGAKVHTPPDVWELSRAAGDPDKSGTLVVGDAVPVSEANALLNKVDRDWWRTVHLPADDQRPVEAPLCEHRYFMPEELPRFVEHLRFNLTHFTRPKED